MSEKTNPKLKAPAQFLYLGGERILIRFAGFQWVMRGTSLQHLKELLVLLDGNLSQSEIIHQLSDRFAPKAVATTLERLLHRQVRSQSHELLGMNPNQRPHPSPSLMARLLVFTSPAQFQGLKNLLPSHWHVEPGTWHLATAPDPSSYYSLLPCPETRHFASTPPSNDSNWDLVVLLPQGESLATIEKTCSSLSHLACPFLMAQETVLGWELGPCWTAQTPDFKQLQTLIFHQALNSEVAFETLAPLESLPYPADPEHNRLKRFTNEIISILEEPIVPKSLGKVIRFSSHKSPVNFSPRYPAAEIEPDQRSRTKTPGNHFLKTYLAFQAMHRPPILENSTQQHPDSVKHIGILGGGTAGFLTALALRKKHPHLRISLIESPDVAVIGVGEATTPLMLQFLHVDLGLDIHQFFKDVRPTFKLGICFDWGPENPGSFPYPFGPINFATNQASQPDLWNSCIQAMLMRAEKLPLAAGKQHQVLSSWDRNIAYHLDNRRFVAYLKKQALKRRIHYISTHVQHANTSDDGQQITSLQTSEKGQLKFDLYVDCSGFSSVLLEKTLGSSFHSYNASLFTDRALVAVVPTPTSLPPFTRATTMQAGWCWNTPQRDAHHCGYVFSSRFISPEDAEREMRAKLPTMGTAKLIRFKTGRHAHFWKGNVVALGNSYGFVEPLESTALHMLIRQIGMLCQAFPLHKNETSIATVLNRRVADYWDYLRWFLALHYRFNKQLDSPFWRTCHHEVNLDSHGFLFDLFKQRGLLSQQANLWQAMAIPDPLWGPEGVDLLLHGMQQGAHQNLPPLPKQWLQQTKQAVKAALSQKEGLKLLDQQPQLLTQLAETFISHGPAF